MTAFLNRLARLWDRISSGWRKCSDAPQWPRWRRLLKMVAALAMLAALYTAADWGQVGEAFANLNANWLTAALLLFVPQTIVSAWRWQGWVADLRRISLLQAVRQTLAASAWNLVLPSKLGDLSKATMLGLPASRQPLAAGRACIEKAADVAALLLLIVAGLSGLGDMLHAALLALAGGFAWTSHWAFLRNTPAQDVGRQVWSQAQQQAAVATEAAASLPARWLPVTTYRYLSLALGSLALWSLHVWQIDCFLRSAGVQAAWSDALVRIPLSIFAGLLPISWCGVGARDTALLWLYSGDAPPAALAAAGLLTVLRYLAPGAVGIPLLGMTGARRAPRGEGNLATARAKPLPATAPVSAATKAHSDRFSDAPTRGEVATADAPGCDNPIGAARSPAPIGTG